MKKCTECKYCVEEEYGYSNYTVEGVTIDCLLGENPDLPEDSFWDEEPALLFADKCGRFVEGETVQIDVVRAELDDRDIPLSSAYTDDPEIKELLDKWEVRTTKR